VTSVTESYEPSRGLFIVGGMIPIQSYRELIAWKKAMALVTDLYVATQSFPKHETYGLAGQIRRAAVSIPSNIAEGQGRLTRGEFRQFLGHARGSIFELESQIVIAQNLQYLSNCVAAELLRRIDELGRILNGLLKSLDARAAH
jgi:four helix bundle protein